MTLLAPIYYTSMEGTVSRKPFVHQRGFLGSV
jgi:hypothetical protein